MTSRQRDCTSKMMKTNNNDQITLWAITVTAGILIKSFQYIATIPQRRKADVVVRVPFSDSLIGKIIRIKLKFHPVNS